MGNKIARTTQVSASEYYLHDLPSSYNLVLIEILGRGRFLKSILCKHDEGLVLVKVYFKRGDPLDLKDYEKRLALIRNIFHSVQYPHVWPFQFWLETDKAAYLLRQYFFSNLHDRLSTRPFLSLIEKKWLAFQLLCAVKQSHDKDVCHGDITCENVLVTSWNWLYLADFASFKPTYIPHDDPSDFSFFFDTGGRRRCYLAPERFYDHGGDTQVAPDAPLKKSMDIFSLGCVIAELFLEGQPLFELSQLHAYRRGQYDPSQYLEKIQDAGIRKMILHMIQLDPESRLSCENYLQSYASAIFPSYFSPFLHKFFSCLIPLDSDTRVAVTQSAFCKIHSQMISNSSNEEVVPGSSFGSSFMNNEPSKNMEYRKQNISSDMDSVNVEGKIVKDTVGREVKLVGDITSLLKEVEDRKHLTNLKALPDNVPNASLYSSDVPSNDTNDYKEKEVPLFRKILKSDLNTLVAGHNSQSDTYEMPIFHGAQHKSCEGMVLIASLLCSCIRNVKQPQLRRAALLLLKSASLYIDDEDRLQHVIPYVIAMFLDQAAIVRCAALETLCDVLALVRDFPPSDAKIFPEYILPMLSLIPDDSEESVRICYASNVFKIALTAYRFLLRSQSLIEAEAFDKLNLPHKEQYLTLEPTEKNNSQSSDTQLVQLRKSIAEVVHELVMGPKQTPNIRRALLQDIAHLCYFFGQRQSNDFLLPILPAFLNDRDEQLRAAFYGQIVYVCYFVGQRSVEEYLLPYIEQALSDVMEAVIVNALECLSMLCRSGFLRKRILLEMIERAFPLLCYPIQWVRSAAVSFIAESSKSLGPVDSYVYLSPVLRPFLLREPASPSCEMSLLSCLKPPVSKLVFYQVLENARSSDMLERQRKIWYNSSPNSNQWETAEHSRRVAGDLNPTRCAKYAGGTTHRTSSQDTEDAAKLRSASSFISSNMADVKDSSFLSDKMQFSGFISPQVVNGNSSLSDGPSEGIPLYSFPTDKHAGEAVSAGPDSLLHWNSIGSDSSCMRWLDPVSKSVESSQVVPPKLVSGSFYDISNSSKLAPKSSRDSEARENKFQDVSVSDTLKRPTSIVSDDSPQSDFTGSTSFARTPLIPDTGWKPRGVLVAHLQEHRSAVNGLVVSNDQHFFISSSDDSTVKIWDTRKLEKDISFRSRLTYHLGGSRALCATMLCGMAQVVVGACDGTLHMFSVDYVSRGSGSSVVERYSGIADIKKKEVGEGAILSLLNCSASDSSIGQTLLYSTLRCGVHLWDTRGNSAAWNFRAVPEEGYISSLVMGQCGNWFVSGSSRGVLTLWDLRFLLPVNSWKYSTVCPIESMCLFIPPANAISAMPRPLLYVAAGCNEVSLWNAESGSCHQVFRIASSESDADISNIPRALARPCFLLLLVVVLLLHLSNAHNITHILADHPEFSTFNHYLTVTHLASEINRRLTITVLAVDNSGMASMLSHHYSLSTLKNVLSLHILVDYYGAKKLHQLTSGTSLSSSFFQSTGAAPGTTGFVNITDHSKGHVTFAAEDTTNSPSSFVKSVKELPYNLSIIQISGPLSSPEAEAPSAAPAPVNLTATLTKGGCKVFSDVISSTADVLKTFEDSMDGGLTMFCPTDAAMNAFMVKFKNLTAAQQISLLLYHGEAVYNSIQMLRDNNGLINTLATTKKKKNYNYVIQDDGDVVSVKTKVTTATIGKTLVDEDPVAIYRVDKVLQPTELFKAVPDADAPAPAMAKKGKNKKAKNAADADADSPDSSPDDDKAADENAALAVGTGRWISAVAAVVAIVGVMV